MTARPHDGGPPCVGFVSAPIWIDPSPADFPALIEGPVRTQQSVMRAPGYDWRLASTPELEPEIAAAGASLAGMGCAAAAICWSPVAWASAGGGAVTEAAARARADRISAAAGLPVVQIGTAVLDMLRDLGIGRVGLACPYYKADWRAGWRDFVAGAGVEAVALTLADIGHWPEEGGGPERWTITRAMIDKTVAAVLEAMPDAEAVVLSGGAARTVAILDDLADAFGRPVFGADAALYRGLARAAGLPLRPGALGRLTGT